MQTHHGLHSFQAFKGLEMKFQTEIGTLALNMSLQTFAQDPRTEPAETIKNWHLQFSTKSRDLCLKPLLEHWVTVKALSSQIAASSTWWNAYKWSYKIKIIDCNPLQVYSSLWALNLYKWDRVRLGFQFWTIARLCFLSAAGILTLVSIDVQMN